MKSDINKKEMIKYINQELKNVDISIEEKEWLKIFKSYYKGKSIREVVETYNKKTATAYRRKKKLEKRFINKEHIDDRKEKNNSLSEKQKKHIKEIINLNPQEVGFVSNTWTGSMLKYYIQYKYNISIETRSCQRILETNYIYDEDKIKQELHKVIQKYKKENKDVWYIRHFSIWKKKKENNKPKPKIRISDLDKEMEGVFMALNLTKGGGYYKSYHENTDKNYEKCINDFLKNKLWDNILLIISRYKWNQSMVDSINSLVFEDNRFTGMKILFKVDELENEDKIEGLIADIKQIGRDTTSVQKFSKSKRKEIEEIINNFKI